MLWHEEILSNEKGMFRKGNKTSGRYRSKRVSKTRGKRKEVQYILAGVSCRLKIGCMGLVCQRCVLGKERNSSCGLVATVCLIRRNWEMIGKGYIHVSEGKRRNKDLREPLENFFFQYLSWHPLLPRISPLRMNKPNTTRMKYGL